EAGDHKMAQSLDFVLADELTHVRFGSEWSREFTKDDPRSRPRSWRSRASSTKRWGLELVESLRP
ncbi:MAG: hypothetical protein ACE1ZX_05935, partial [Acidimicrobiia bacterium]